MLGKTNISKTSDYHTTVMQLIILKNNENLNWHPVKQQRKLMKVRIPSNPQKYFVVVGIAILRYSGFYKKKKIKNVGQSPSSLHLDVAQRKLDVYINSTSPKPIILHKNTERQLETVNIIKKKKKRKSYRLFSLDQIVLILSINATVMRVQSFVFSLVLPSGTTGHLYPLIQSFTLLVLCLTKQKLTIPI